MSAIEKLKYKLFEKPARNDMTFEEITKLAESYGCQVVSGGNHMKIIYRELGYVIPIPCHGKCVKEVYIRQLQNLFIEISG